MVSFSSEEKREMAKTLAAAKKEHKAVRAERREFLVSLRTCEDWEISRLGSGYNKLSAREIDLENKIIRLNHQLGRKQQRFPSEIRVARKQKNDEGVGDDAR
ncbi:hypothetical protein FACS1894103_5740 [Campylobacterota bacterium]|nr:hypothetical protein FACS1894103_5740 [Campylobacterota bacterium]